MKNYFCLPVIIFVTLVACSFRYEEPVPPASRSVTLKVMSYNIHHCNPPSKPDSIDLFAVARVIRTQNPDLVALQEVDMNTVRSGKGLYQARELGRLTQMYSFFVKTIGYQGGEYGIAILSKYPIIDSAAYQLPSVGDTLGEPRGLAVVSVKLNTGREVTFASTHLDLKVQNQELQIKKIIELLKMGSRPLIIAGDFNARPGSGVIKVLDEAFVRTCTDCQPTIPVINPDRTIDHIAFYPGNTFRILKHSVLPERYASDHLPVVAELEILKK